MAMKGNRAASRYAKAILSLAREKNLAQELNADFELIRNTMDESPDLRVILKSPVVSVKIKRNTLEAIFTNINPLTHQVLDLLLKNNRIDVLYLVAVKYELLFNEMNHEQVALVTTAVPLTGELEGKIRAKVEELTGNRAKIENKVDSAILGGFILRVGDMQYDASVASQLIDLKREFQNYTYVSKL